MEMDGGEATGSGRQLGGRKLPRSPEKVCEPGQLLTRDVVKAFITERWLESLELELLATLDLDSYEEHVDNHVLWVLRALDIFNRKRPMITATITRIVEKSFNSLTGVNVLENLYSEMADILTDGIPDESKLIYSWNTVFMILMATAEATVHAISQGTTEYVNGIIELCISFLHDRRMDKWIEYMGGWKSLPELFSKGLERLFDNYEAVQCPNDASSECSSPMSSAKLMQLPSPVHIEDPLLQPILASSPATEIAQTKPSQDNQFYQNMRIHPAEEYHIPLELAKSLVGISVLVVPPPHPPHLPANMKTTARMIPAEVTIPPAPDQQDAQPRVIRGTLMTITNPPEGASVFIESPNQCDWQQSTEVPHRYVALNPQVQQISLNLQQLLFQDSGCITPVEASFVMNKLADDFEVMSVDD